MQVRLHANATTTPRTRAYIQTSTAPIVQIARELGISETTVRRWKPRATVADGSHVARRLAVSLTDLEERLVVELRTALQLPLDDIVEVMRRCMNPKLSRSAIHRCLKRHGVSARPKPARRQIGTFEAAGVGFIHVDLKHLTRLNGQPSFVFVAIDRATRFVHIESITRRDATTVATCLERFLAAFPHKVHTILPTTARSSPTASAAPSGAKNGVPADVMPSIGCAPGTASSTGSSNRSGRKPTASLNASTAAWPRPSAPGRAWPGTKERTSSLPTPSAMPSSLAS
jgi:transposase